MDDVLNFYAEAAVVIDGRFPRAVEEIKRHAVGIFAQMTHPVGDQLVILGQEVAHVLCEGNAHLAGVLFDGCLGRQMGDIKGFKILFEGFRGDLHARDGLHILLDLAVGGVSGAEPRPVHIFLDSKARGAVAPVVAVAAHQGVDQQAVRRPGEIFRVFRDGLKDDGHFVILVAVADVLVAVGVRLGIGHGDAVGGGMKFPAALHIRPDAADEIGGGAVAQHIVFLHPRGDGLIKNIQQRGGGFIDKMIELLQADGKTVAVKGNEFYVNAAKGADAKEADADVVIQVAVPAQTTVELCSTEAQAILSQENCIAIFGSNQTAAEGVLAANANLNVLGSDAGAGDVIGVGFDAGSIIKAAVQDGTFIGAVTQSPLMMGYYAIYALTAAANGQELEDVPTDGYWYDSTNMDSEEIAPNLYD